MSDNNNNKKLVEIINKWANSIPNHDLRNFGDKIKISETEEYDGYSLHIKTQTDVRHILINQKPYYGESLSRRIYFHPTEINIWDLEGYDLSDWTITQHQEKVEGSEYVEKCGSCSGSGQHTCPKCKGAKRFTCGTCGGKGKSRCSSCNGQGRRSTSCGCNSGLVWNSSNQRYQTCPSCHGSGRITSNCGVCGGSGISSCSACNGNGTITCSKCDGKGYIVCSTCSGTGKILIYYVLNQKLNYSSDENLFTGQSFINKHPRFGPDPLFNGEMKIQVDTEELNGDECDEYDNLTGAYQSSLTEVKRIKGPNCHIRRQLLEVEKFDIYNVDYEYENKQYSLGVIEPCGEIHDESGPMYQQRRKYYEEAKALREKRKVSKAYPLALKANQMIFSPRDPEIKELMDGIGVSLERIYKIGIAAALFVFACLFGYGTYFYLHEPLVYLPHLKDYYASNPDLSSINVFTLPLFYIFGLYSVYQKSFSYINLWFGFDILQWYKRFSLSFVVGVIFALIFAGITFLVSYSGVLFLLDYAVYWGSEFIMAIMPFIEIVITILGWIVGIIIWLLKLIYSLFAWLFGLIF